MKNQSRVTYVQPKEKFKMISLNLISNFDPIVVGIYCKIVTLSSGKSLSMDWIVKKVGIGKERTRKAIILLEEKGYIQRMPLRDDKGHICGWNYLVYPEPIREKDRTHAGKKENEPDLFETQPMENPTYGNPSRLESGTHIIIDNSISNNGIDNISSINTPDKEDVEKTSKEVKSPQSLTEEERVYTEKMKERYPRIMKMEKPLTLDQAKKLKKKYDADLISKIMDDMENYKQLLKRYVSAYLTIGNWCQRELDKS